MEAPRDVDLRALNAFLGDVESAADSELVAVVVGGLAGLVPCDCALYTRARTADDTHAGAYIVSATDACIEADRNAQQSLWFQLIELDEHPVVAHWGRTQDPTPIRVSDVATRRQFHRCGIYDLFLRNWGIEHTLAVRLRRGREVHDFACYRKRTDFSERDRLVLDLFRRYLSILIAPAVAKLPLTSRELEILELVALGKSNAEAAEILVVAPGTIKKHLDNIYEKVGVRTRTAAAIRATGQRPRWPDLTSPRANDTAIAAGELVTAELERRHRP